MIRIETRWQTVTFDGQHITIHRRRSTPYLSAGEKTIAVQQVSGIRWKPAGRWMSGYMVFTIPGSVELRGKPTGKDIARNENAVIFGPKQRAQFEKLRAAVQAAIGQGGTPADRSVADELAKLAALAASGSITDAEFQQAKARLLGR